MCTRPSGRPSWSFLLYAKPSPPPTSPKGAAVARRQPRQPPSACDSEANRPCSGAPLCRTCMPRAGPARRRTCGPLLPDVARCGGGVYCPLAAAVRAAIWLGVCRQYRCASCGRNRRKRCKQLGGKCREWGGGGRVVCSGGHTRCRSGACGGRGVSSVLAQRTRRHRKRYPW